MAAIAFIWLRQLKNFTTILINFLSLSLSFFSFVKSHYIPSTNFSFLPGLSVLTREGAAQCRTDLNRTVESVFIDWYQQWIAIWRGRKWLPLFPYNVPRQGFSGLHVDLTWLDAQMSNTKKKQRSIRLLRRLFACLPIGVWWLTVRWRNRAVVTRRVISLTGLIRGEITLHEVTCFDFHFISLTALHEETQWVTSSRDIYIIFTWRFGKRFLW